MNPRTTATTTTTTTTPTFIPSPLGSTAVKVWCWPWATCPIPSAYSGTRTGFSTAAAATVAGRMPTLRGLVDSRCRCKIVHSKAPGAFCPEIVLHAKSKYQLYDLQRGSATVVARYGAKIHRNVSPTHSWVVLSFLEYASWYSIKTGVE